MWTDPSATDDHMAIDFEKIKSTAADWTQRGKEAALNFLDDFKRQTPYFKARVGVVSGFAFLILFTFIIAPAPGVPDPCKVKVVATDLAWKMVVEVINESGSDHEQLQVVVHGTQESSEGVVQSGTWRTKKRRLSEDKRLLLDAKHLKDKKGDPPNLDFRPSSVEVHCEDGVFRTNVTPRTL